MKLGAGRGSCTGALERVCGIGLPASSFERLYQLYRERIAYFRMNPPPPNWDGAAEALSK